MLTEQKFYFDIKPRLCLPWPIFLPLYVSVCAWQLGHNKRRLTKKLFVASPSIWSSSSGMGKPFQLVLLHSSHWWLRTLIRYKRNVRRFVTSPLAIRSAVRLILLNNCEHVLLQKIVRDVLHCFSHCKHFRRIFRRFALLYFAEHDLLQNFFAAFEVNSSSQNKQFIQMYKHSDTSLTTIESPYWLQQEN